MLSFKNLHVGWSHQDGKWKFCPTCGKERPKEAKKLSETLNEDQWSNQVDFNRVAQLAIQWFEEKIEECRSEINIMTLIENPVDVNKLKQKIREGLVIVTGKLY